MKKNIKVNVSGMLFNLDEDAHQALEIYLTRLERHFSNTDGRKEIIEDIERGIADMMNAKLSAAKTIITIEDINEIIKEMGEPGQIGDDSDQNNEEFTSSESNQRRLYRDVDNGQLAGVCSGISHYLNVDVAWIRILFVLILFASGLGLIVYLVLWVAVPEAVTTAQKLEMRGESINIDNIEKRIKEEFNNIGNQINNIKNKHFSKKKTEISRIINDFLSAIIKMIGLAGKIFLIVVGIGLTIGALALLIMLMPAFISGSGNFYYIYSDFVYFSIPEIVASISSSSGDYNMIFYSLIAVLLIPLLSIIIGGLGYLIGFRTEAKGINKALGILWVIGIILLTISVFRTFDEFKQKETVTEEFNLTIKSRQQVLLVKINPNLTNYPDLDENLEKVYNALDNDFIIFKTDSLYYSTPEIETYASDDSMFHVKISKFSQGQKRQDARQNITGIKYPIKMNDSILEISPLFQFPARDNWRNQKVKLKIYIPKGRRIKLIDNPSIEPGLIKEIEQEMQFDCNEEPIDANEIESITLK